MLKINVFRDSFAPVSMLLKEYGIKYRTQEMRSDMISSAPIVIEIIQSTAIWGSLSAVIITYLKNKANRKIIITTKDNQIIHAENINSNELEKILEYAKEITAIDSKKSAQE